MNTFGFYRLYYLGQGWTTQIGLWAATRKFSLKYRLFGPHDDKNLKKYTQNIEKSLILDLSSSRRNFFLGRGFLATPDLGIPIPI
jgi:hypothetical protein